MRVAQIARYGGPEVVEIVDIADATLQPDQILVRVQAVAVNPFDWKLRNGWLAEMVPLQLPIILGNEFAGVIEKIADGVTGFAVGDRVHGVTGTHGAFAELVSVPADAIAHVPPGLSISEAAAVPVAAVTAVAELDAGQVGRDTRVLIHAAAGGVGIFAVQLAVERGAHVTALGSAGNLDFLRSLGAHEVLDRAGDYAAGLAPFDVVIDNYGADVHAKSVELLKEGGHLISISAPVDEALLKEKKIQGQMVFGGANGAVLKQVDDLIEAGKVKLFVAETRPITEIQDVMRQSETLTTRGKLVLSFD